MNKTKEAANWYSAKCLYRRKPVNGIRRQLFEERIILIRANSFDSAKSKAELESNKYSTESDLIEFVEILDIYELDSVKEITDGQEIYSLIFSSNLKPKAFIEKYFPNPQLDDCSKHKLRHRWYKINHELKGCYHCLKTQKTI